MRVERSRAAEADLDDILVFSLEHYGTTVTNAYFFSFEDAFSLLERHSAAGEAVDHIDPGVRRLKHRKHRVFYQLMSDHVLVLRILHHAVSLDERF